jgi:hypothetical protein
MESLSETNESVYRHARQSRLPKNFPLAAYQTHKYTKRK